MGEWTPDAFRDLADYWSARLVLESAALDIYGQLADGALSGPELAGLLDLDERATVLFLDALAALELLEKEGGRYRNSATAARYLDPRSPEYLGHGLIAARNAWEVWNRLPAALRKGELRPRRIFVDEPVPARHLLLAIHGRALDRVAEMLERGWLDLGGRRKMLDLGGGAGTYSVAFCEANPELSCTLFDRPIAAALALEQVAAAGLESRIEVLEGDFEADEVPGSYDLVWVSNVIHGRGDDSNRALFSKVHSLLEPGGEVIVHDIVMEEDRTRPMRGAVFSIHLLVNAVVGRCYTFEEIRRWLDAAGFEDVRRIGDHRDEHNLVTGKRR